MKTLDKMNNLDRANLLARLFPGDLKALTEFIKKEADLFTKNKFQAYQQWTEKNITADLWFNFINNFQRKSEKYATRLHRNKKIFRNQLFDGYDALFTIHAVIHYSQQSQCNPELKHAICMLFGNKKLITIKFKT